MTKSPSSQTLEQVIACPGCDLLVGRQHLNPGEKLYCPRCNEVLLAPKKNSIERSLALSLTVLLLFPSAMFLPIMTLDTMGLKNSGSIFDGVISTMATKHVFVGIILALTSIFFPLIKLALLFLVSLNLKLKRHPKTLPLMMRSYIHLDEWGMLEVFMIGVLVTIIKIHHMAHIRYDAGFFCFVGLMLVALCSSAMLDEDNYWHLIEEGKRR